MDEEAKTKAIEKWLRMVDKPLGDKRGRQKAKKKKAKKKKDEQKQ